MSYGMPYMGSKSMIAKDIIRLLPDADCFIDLFGGGGAMTQCALESKKYNKVIYNEKETLVYNGFKMAVTGQFKNEKRWISRESFNILKLVDPYVIMCYSFGNKLRAYGYSKILEPWKEALHYARVLKDYSKLKQFGIDGSGSKADIIKNFNMYKQKYIDYIKADVTCDAVHFAELEHLERLERLNSIYNSLNGICFGDVLNVECFNSSYENINIPENSVVYCDPPYIDVSNYLSTFNHEDFYNWCRAQKSLVFISEYTMPDDFYLLHTFKRKDLLGDNKKTITECLYCNKPYKISGQVKKLF